MKGNIMPDPKDMLDEAQPTQSELNNVCTECNDTKELEDGSFLGLDEDEQPVYETWKIDCPNCFVDEHIIVATMPKNVKS
jgi:hypothetical protein